MPDSSPSLENVLRRLAELGCTAAYVKVLAQNDNNKNQPYLSKTFEGLHLLPHGELTSEGEGDRIRYKANLNFAWLNNELIPFVAPEAKLILYPQYPEVRLSGFLAGCKDAPSKLMSPRKEGYTIPPRILMLAVNEQNGKVLAYLAAKGTEIYHDLFESIQHSEKRGVLFDLTSQLPVTNTKQQLIEKLLEIAQEGWIVAKRLDRGGNVLPCQAPNCGGCTLEAELDIRPNSRSEPDFLGWEVKQHTVTSFVGLAKKLSNKGAVITLMTPEPTGGVYVEDGVEQFIRRYGYPDQSGKVDRLNFGGKYAYGVPYHLTGVRLTTTGFNPEKGKIDGDGGISLLYGAEELPIAVWKFSDLLRHWSRKHAKAVYVPSMSRREPQLSYRFADLVRLGEGTDFLRFLRAVHSGVVFYDPGIKLEYASTTPKVKRRSQFRILSGNLSCLYDKMTVQGLN
jgi:MvaI/BcnI restriction endonuclease family